MKCKPFPLHQGITTQHGPIIEQCDDILQEKQRAEAAAKKLEAKKMAEEEAAQLASSAKKSSSKSASTSKVHLLSVSFHIAHALYFR